VSNGGCPIISEAPRSGLMSPAEYERQLAACDRDPEDWCNRCSTRNDCSDADRDRVPNALDACPGVPGLRDSAHQGCPAAAAPPPAPAPAVGAPARTDDRDGDGAPDAIDKCPDVPGLRTGPDADGCPDRDGDGMPDIIDKCPDSKGVYANRGCPADDRDQDGVPDPIDKCPDTPGIGALDVTWNGCPVDDGDGDGVVDLVDKCPYVAGLTTGVSATDGCRPANVASAPATFDASAISRVMYEYALGSSKNCFKDSPGSNVEYGAEIYVDPRTKQLAVRNHVNGDEDSVSMKMNARYGVIHSHPTCHAMLSTKDVSALVSNSIFLSVVVSVIEEPSINDASTVSYMIMSTGETPSSAGKDLEEDVTKYINEHIEDRNNECPGNDQKCNFKLLIFKYIMAEAARLGLAVYTSDDIKIPGTLGKFIKIN
jgi:proteasome lid subunit RPN8/RPN11